MPPRFGDDDTVPDVEFVPEPDGGTDDVPRRAAHRAPVTRRGVPRRALVAGVAVLVAAAVAVVITQRPDTGTPAAAPGAHVASSSGPEPTPSPTVLTLALPEQLAFGPETQSLLAVGNRIYGLTSRLIGAVQRDGGSLVVRPTTAGLITGTPKLVLDGSYHTVWAVAIGGTSIGSFDSTTLASRADQTAPGAIRAATALFGELWFVTVRGLYRIGTRARTATLVATEPGLVAVAADPTRKRVLVVGDSGIIAVGTSGQRELTAPVPFAHADDLAVAGGEIWTAGHNDTGGLLFHLDATDLHPDGPATAAGTTGAASVLATYATRLVVTGIGKPGTMTCLRGDTGRVLQTWSYQRGAAVALNERGLLVSEGKGIELRSAYDCVAGS